MPICHPEIWAKSPNIFERTGMALAEHMEAVTEQAFNLISYYRPYLAKHFAEDVFDSFLFAAALHDLGKIHPGFQESLRKKGQRFPYRHEILSLLALQWLPLQEEKISYCATAVALHHKGWRLLTKGDPVYFRPERAADEIHPLLELVGGMQGKVCSDFMDFLRLAFELIRRYSSAVFSPDRYNPDIFDTVQPKWNAGSLYDQLGKVRTFVNSLQRNNGFRSAPDQQNVLQAIIVRGIILTSDHIASALGQTVKIKPAFENVCDTLEKLGLVKEQLRPHQQLLSVWQDNAMLIAPTGSGKTEAALLWAASLRMNSIATGRLLYLLPVRASMNGMALRLQERFGKENISLVHGKSLVQAYERAGEEGLAPQEAGARAGAEESLARLNAADLRISSPFQIIKPFLLTKNSEEYLLSFLGAQIIVDEVHAYAPKIAAITLAIIRYLVECLDAKFLLMTATLPTHMLQCIQGIFPALPQPVVPEKKILSSIIRHRIKKLPFSIIDVEVNNKILEDAKTHSVLVVVNNPSRAIRLAQKLEMACPEFGLSPDCVQVLHSMFSARDRNRIEGNLSVKPGTILVATQVVEVSLNLDYDRGYFEIAPLESLLQRFGRVNRFGSKGIVDVHICMEFPADEKETGPYAPFHLQACRQAIETFSLTHPDGILSEADVQGLVDSSYPLELKEELTKQVREQEKVFYRYVVSEYLPLGVYDNEHLKDIEGQWEDLFDAVEVIPSCYLPEVAKAENKIELAGLLVPVSSKQLAFLKRSGKVEFNNEIGYFIVDVPYHLKYGLLLGSTLNLDISSYINGHIEKAAETDSQQQARQTEARERAQKIAQALSEKFPGIQVYLFGSILTELFDLDSDIDLAVSGLAEEDFMRAYGIAEDIAEPIPIDLVQIEFANDSLRQSILRDGIKL